jgi:SPP1 gp7 family putative phage head morphogenesis protein
MKDNISMKLVNNNTNTIQLAREDQVVKAKSLTVDLVRLTLLLTKKDIGRWRLAQQTAINVLNPKRYLLYDIYDDNMLDLHLLGAIRNRKLKVLSKAFKVIDIKNREENTELTEMLRSRWFKKFLNQCLDVTYYGPTLIQFGDIVINGNKRGFSDVSIVPRRHVCPEFGVILKNISDDPKTGIEYRKQFADWSIEIGDPEELGLLNALSHQCISKRNMFAFWDQFGEIFGMPIRIANTFSRDETEKSKIAKMLEGMGSAAWGVFGEDTKIDVKESSRGDAFNVYDKRIERANTEMSKAVLGQTMTMDSGSSKSQAEVHETVSDEIAWSDMEDLRDIINDKLFPFLNKHGFGLENYLFDWDESYEYTFEDMLSIEEMILANFDVDPKYFIDKHNIPIIGIKNKGNTIDVTPKPDTQKKKLSLNSDLLTLISEQYKPCPDCGGTPMITLATNDEMNAEADRIAQMIFDGEAFEGGIDLEMSSRVSERLKSAMIHGFGSDFPKMDYNTPDYQMLANLDNNVYSFSVAKNYNELKQATMLLKDGDKVRSFSEFKAEVSKLHQVFNVDYLQTEYNTAINSAEMAGKWAGFEQNKEAMSMLRYQTVGDKRVRAEHRALDGVQRKVDDPFWNSYYPPNGWRCRCTVNQSGQGGQTNMKNIKVPDVQTMFKTNMAKEGVLFPTGHAYYTDFPDSAKNKVYKVQAKAVSTWAQDNLAGKDIKLMTSQLEGVMKVTQQGIDDAINQPHSMMMDKNRILFNLDSVIQKSTYKKSTPGKDETIEKTHYLEFQLRDKPSYLVINEMKTTGHYTFASIIEKLK